MSKMMQQMRDTVSTMNETIAQLSSHMAAVGALGEGYVQGAGVGVDKRHAKPPEAAQVASFGDRIFMAGGPPPVPVAQYNGSFVREASEARDTIPASSFSGVPEQSRADSAITDTRDEVTPSETLVKALHEAIFRTEGIGVGEDGWEALSRRVLLALAHYEADSEVF